MWANVWKGPQQRSNELCWTLKRLKRLRNYLFYMMVSKNWKGRVACLPVSQMKVWDPQQRTLGHSWAIFQVHFWSFFIHSHVWFFHGEVTFYDSLPMTASTRNIKISSKGLSLMCFILSIHAKNFDSKFWLGNFSLEFQLRISGWIFRAEIFSLKIQLPKNRLKFSACFLQAEIPSQNFGS